MISAGFRSFCVGSLVCVAVTAGGAAFARGDGADHFYKACYTEDTNPAEAAKLYEQALRDGSLNAELQAEARRRLQGCREEVACADFARLMPPQALAYVELNRPGAKLNELLDALGLLAAPGWLQQNAPQVAISPVLLQELLGLKGAALAVTGFDPFKQVPSGVLVLHPGNLKIVRGLIETALPVQGTSIEPIAGFPTYEVKEKAIVTLTSKLVIVSTSRRDIEAVVRRLKGQEKESLATQPGAVFERDVDGDALVRLYINAKPVMPLVAGIASMAGAPSEEIARVQAILDPDSLQSLSGRIDVGAEGIGLQVALNLEDGHHNLVYNLLRTPAVDHEILGRIPKGAAAFIVGALNEADSRYGSARSQDAAIISALDFGREIFANITSLAAFVLPRAEDSATGSIPIPDAGLVLSVNDPAKSAAMWTQILGLVNLFTGAGGMEGSTVELADRDVRTYTIQGGPTIHFTLMDNDMFITGTRSAMRRAIQARRIGDSIMNDRAFSASLARFSDVSTKGLFVHAGRCAELARPFMPQGESVELEAVLGALENTVAAFTTEHSNELLRLSFRVTGVPDVSELVTAKIMGEKQRKESRAELAGLIRKEDWDKAIAVIDRHIAENSDNVELLRKKFDVLAVHRKDPVAAERCAERILEVAHDQPRVLNNFAWALLTKKKYGAEYGQVALRASQRSNDLTDSENWRFLDTLALASFKTGDAKRAVELEKKAIERCSGQGIGSLRKALARFEAAATPSEVSMAGGQE